MIDIRAVQGHTIALGRLGENNYTRILFDVSEWLAEYPQATIGLLNVRPGETIAYPVSPGNLSLDNGILYWIVTSTDLSVKGTGRCELVAFQGNTIMKSAIYKTMCLEALDGGATPPEPWESWQSFFQELADEAAQSANEAEAAVEHYPRIVDGVWEVWDAQEGAFVSTGVQAQGPQGIPGEQGEPGEPGPQGETGPQGEPGADGATFTPAVSAEGVISWTNNGGKPNPQPMNIKGPQGDDGTSPTVSVADITGGHRVTVTDANGTRSFDVMDGDDYTLTAADKAEIAQQAAEEVDVPVQDVQVNGQSVLTDGVANITPADLSFTIQVTGTTPSITALPGIQYICGEVSTLDITLPASGCIDVVFQSGSTPTVLTITPPTGVTIKWANGFDPTSLEANATYEINIMDGLGVAVSWT